jgi:hypothetical protein
MDWDEEFEIIEIRMFMQIDMLRYCVCKTVDWSQVRELIKSHPRVLEGVEFSMGPGGFVEYKESM